MRVDRKGGTAVLGLQRVRDLPMPGDSGPGNGPPAPRLLDPVDRCSQTGGSRWACCWRLRSSRSIFSEELARRLG